MDGLPEQIRTAGVVSCQRTLKSSISCVGVGLHSGQRANLTLHPAAPGTGIVFRRTDLGVEVPARYDLVTETCLCTAIGTAGSTPVRVCTVEHLVAALTAVGVDNVLVELDGPEVPVLDGSAAPFLFLIDCAGVVDQAATRQVIEVLQPVRVESGEAFAELRPAAFGLELALSIDFPAQAIGRQALTLRLTEASFRTELAASRTFTQRADIEAMQEAGLARGGSLDNAVVVDGAQVLNPEGLRQPDEFVRHKMLDAVGDLGLAGSAIQGRFVAHRTGHTLNNALLRALFANASAWRIAAPEPVSRFYSFTARAA
jgi:UDP-3-O-[3-hydroxymyristoyl] N-acetylglucosamine deacetylase